MSRCKTNSQAGLLEREGRLRPLRQSVRKNSIIEQPALKEHVIVYVF